MKHVPAWVHFVQTTGTVYIHVFTSKYSVVCVYIRTFMYILYTHCMCCVSVCVRVHVDPSYHNKIIHNKIIQLAKGIINYMGRFFNIN